MKSPIAKKLSKWTACALCLTISEVKAADNSSLSDLGIEFTEAKLTLQTLSQNNEFLKQELANSQKQVQALSQSLVIATSEEEVFKRQASEMKLQMEALGVASVNPDRSKLEQRLLKAVSDLRILQSQKEALSNQLIRLMEASLQFEKIADTQDVKAKVRLEETMREGTKVLGATEHGDIASSSKTANSSNIMVISVKDDLGLAVINRGSLSGVKIGMPFEVMRNGETIALVRIVDVREKIAGALIQSLKSEKTKIKVGDTLKLDVQQ